MTGRLDSALEALCQFISDRFGGRPVRADNEDDGLRFEQDKIRIWVCVAELSSLDVAFMTGSELQRSIHDQLAAIAPEPKRLGSGDEPIIDGEVIE